jgi:hypothetical protein
MFKGCRSELALAKQLPDIALNESVPGISSKEFDELNCTTNQAISDEWSKHRSAAGVCASVHLNPVRFLSKKGAKVSGVIKSSADKSFVHHRTKFSFASATVNGDGSVMKIQRHTQNDTKVKHFPSSLLESRAASQLKRKALRATQFGLPACSVTVFGDDAHEVVTGAEDKTHSKNDNWNMKDNYPQYKDEWQKDYAQNTNHSWSYNSWNNNSWRNGSWNNDSWRNNSWKKNDFSGYEW